MISANGYGLDYDGQRLNTLDRTRGLRVNVTGSTVVESLISLQHEQGPPFGSIETLELDEDIVAANMEVSWSTGCGR